MILAMINKDNCSVTITNGKHCYTKLSTAPESHHKRLAKIRKVNRMSESAKCTCRLNDVEGEITESMMRD